MQTHINIRTDSEIKEQAQALFARLGLDMTTAVNLFLRQTLREQAIPFGISLHPAENRAAPPRRPLQYDSLKGKIRVADDFDAPLEDFREYM
ncbi:MAG: type II toxin-antitoxin system RelB/DinJ family antitoxin [Candidatus Accumulibacter sp.]|jgi:DNA-damage-inducible protein J|nr:type II toxin-antitoxin system RelB/DinJ family antitoxin [Accumulibacter sp.]